MTKRMKQGIFPENTNNTMVKNHILFVTLEGFEPTRIFLFTSLGNWGGHPITLYSASGSSLSSQTGKMKQKLNYHNHSLTYLLWNFTSVCKVRGLMAREKGTK